MSEIFDAVNALAVVVLVVLTAGYARSTARMLKEMSRQARIMVLSAQVSAHAALTQSTYDASDANAALKGLLEELTRLSAAKPS